MRMANYTLSIYRWSWLCTIIRSYSRKYKHKGQRYGPVIICRYCVHACWFTNLSRSARNELKPEISWCPSYYVTSLKTYKKVKKHLPRSFTFNFTIVRFFTFSSVSRQGQCSSAEARFRTEVLRSAWEDSHDNPDKVYNRAVRRPVTGEHILVAQYYEIRRRCEKIWFQGLFRGRPWDTWLNTAKRGCFSYKEGKCLACITRYCQIRGRQHPYPICGMTYYRAGMA